MGFVRKNVGCLTALAALLAGTAWLMLVGHHRHVVEIRRKIGPDPSALVFRLTGRRSPFSIATPDTPTPSAHPLSTGMELDLFSSRSTYRTDHLAASVYPNGGVNHSLSVVSLPASVTSSTFSLDGIPFTWTSEAGLSGAGHTWPAPPAGEAVEIDLDPLLAPGR